MLFLCCAGYLLLPCLAAGLLFGQVFPFFLKGPQFLVFYLIHMAIACGILLLLKQRALPVRTCANWFLALTYIVALARITQGWLHHRPVGFLVLLLLLHLLLLGGLARFTARSR